MKLTSTDHRSKNIRITASIASITAVVGLSALKEGVVIRAPAELRRLGVATSLAAAGMKCRMFNMIAK